MWKRRSKVDFEKLKMSSEELSLEPSYSTMEKTVMLIHGGVRLY